MHSRGKNHKTQQMMQKENSQTQNKREVKYKLHYKFRMFQTWQVDKSPPWRLRVTPRGCSSKRCVNASKCSPRFTLTSRLAAKTKLSEFDQGVEK